MRTFIIVTLITFCSYSIFGQNINATIKFKTKSQTLKTLIKTIETQTQYKFTYSKSTVPINKKIELTKTTYQLKEILEKGFKKNGLKYVILNKNIAIKSAPKATLSGIISDSKTKETLIGATLYFPDYNIGTVTNAYGFFSVNIPEGKHNVHVSFIGYKDQQAEIQIKNNTRQAFFLEQKTVEVSEVLVTAKKKNDNIINNTLGKETISVEYLNSFATFGGEPDVLKTMQSLSGVNATIPGTTQISVHGGSFDQNLVLLDEAPVYNPSHTLGFFSVFNPDVFKTSDIYKSYIPANFGGRLSSVVDIRTKDGNKEKLSVDAGVGLISSKLTLQGPIGKNTSFVLAGRYSYVGKVLNLVEESGTSIARELEQLGNNSEIDFYDINLKLNHIINRNNRVYLSMYKGNDHFYYANIDDESSMDWGNTTSTLRWNMIFSDKLFLNTSLIYSNYAYHYILKDDSQSYNWDADLTEYNLKLDFDYNLINSHKLKFGGEISYNKIEPGNVSPRNSSSNSIVKSLDKKDAKTYALYLNDDITINDQLSGNIGLRLSGLNTNNTTQQSYVNIEPRLSFRYLLNATSSIKFGYSRTVQYMHLMSNSSLGLPTDIWLPSDHKIKPQKADNYSLGLFKNFKDDTFQFSVEGYYKNMYNIIDFVDNSELFMNEDIHSQILSGKGKAYGMDVSLKKLKGKTSYQVSYSYSRSLRTIEGINQNKEYAAVYDRPHNIKLALTQQLFKNLKASANFTYSSGGLYTVPTGSYLYKGISFLSYSERNGYRAPDFHSLDLLFTYVKKHKKFTSEFKLGVYNVYGRKNIFTLMMQPDEYNINKMIGKKMYLFSTVPTFTYNIKF